VSHLINMWVSSFAPDAPANMLNWGMNGAVLLSQILPFMRPSRHHHIKKTMTAAYCSECRSQGAGPGTELTRPSMFFYRPSYMGAKLGETIYCTSTNLGIAVKLWWTWPQNRLASKSIGPKIKLAVCCSHRLSPAIWIAI